VQDSIPFDIPNYTSLGEKSDNHAKQIFFPLETYIQNTAPEVRCECAALHGETIKETIHRANIERAIMIVIATSGFGPKNSVIGSTSLDLIRSKASTIPVLVTKQRVKNKTKLMKI